jgi:hypothetical protein
MLIVVIANYSRRREMSSDIVVFIIVYFSINIALTIQIWNFFPKDHKKFEILKHLFFGIFIFIHYHFGRHFD